MNITNRGKKWEFLNSLWLIWSFTLLLACVSFFWIGGRTGKRKWIISGLIYLISNLGVIPISIWLKEVNPVYNNICIVVCYIGWFAAIIHAFMSRKEYLIRREAVMDLKNATRDAYRNEIRKDYFGNNEKPVQQSPLSETKQDVLQHHPTEKIDLNTASDQDIANLPGVGVALAKKAIEIRIQTGSFVSVQDFCRQLDLMPHFVAQIENLAFVTPIKSQTSSEESSGRIIDI